MARNLGGRRVISRALLALVPAVLALPTPAVQDVQGERFVTIAEGFTSGNLRRGIDVQHRRFAAPDMPGICAAAPRPATLHQRGPTPVLRVNEWFSLDSLIIVGYDVGGRLLPPLPIVVEVEEHQPPRLDLRSQAVSESRFLPIGEGRVRFRARPLCHDGDATVLITATIERRSGR